MDLLAYALVAVITALTVLALAGVARRLLGLRFGILRTLLAGIIAFVLSGPLFSAMHAAGDSDTGAAGQFGLLVLAATIALLVLAATIALLAAMIFLVLAEVLVPAGSVPPPYEWWRLTRARAARTRRYGQIVRIAVRHGLGRALRGRWRGGADPARRRQLARSLTTALDEGGVTFVKLGQLLSTRARPAAGQGRAGTVVRGRGDPGGRAGAADRGGVRDRLAGAAGRGERGSGARRDAHLR